MIFYDIQFIIWLCGVVLCYVKKNVMLCYHLLEMIETGENSKQNLSTDKIYKLNFTNFLFRRYKFFIFSI